MLLFTIMSLSKAIIYNDVQNVIQAVKHGAKLDVIDEYGYTPLIQTAIMDSVNKAAVIINAGAKIDFPDLTGRTALHWATDGNNLKLCKLLLEHKANPNAYTLAGQPVLVMPILRHQKELVKLLHQYGADFKFAKDFINAKLLAHRYELHGHVDIVDKTKTLIEIDFEGFYLEFTIAAIHNSLQDFRNNFGARHLRKYFKDLDKLITSFVNASELIKYQHYNVDKSEHEEHINELLSKEPLLLPIGYAGHGVSLIKYKNLFAHCDRGLYGKTQGPLNIYRIGAPKIFNHKFSKKLLYTRQEKFFVENEMHNMLGLKPFAQLLISLQTTGNCSWANIEAAIPAIMFLLLLDQGNPNDRVYVNQCQKTAMSFYQEWLEWDKTRSLKHFMYNLEEIPHTRQVTKAALLAAILFQKCDYQDDKDFARAKIIAPILARDEFRYIVESYIEVFLKQHRTSLGKNLAEILESFGVDVEE